MTKPTIYLDLDGVLANFDKRAEEVLGTDNIYKFEFVYGTTALWNGINSDPFFFKNLEVMPGARRLLEATRYYPNVILTALPKSNAARVDEQKREWVKEHLGGRFPVITCLTKEKPAVCKPGDLLIDDRAIVKSEWEARGGKFIVHTSVENTLEQLKTLGFPPLEHSI